MKDDPWAPYEPGPAAPWDLRRVVHLHRRAGFAATWDELQRDLQSGPEVSVGRLLAGEARAESAPENFESTAALIGNAAVSSGDPARLKAWWVYRMLFSPDPLGERLTLMWHNHFATSNLKVNDLAAMRRQNDTFRKLSRAPFGVLLDAVVRDPALLVWLDAQSNRKGHPNENLARELMELYTVGLGHFGEGDVKEAARTLTGWSVEEGQFVAVNARHDEGEKTILGHTGRYNGADLVKILREHPATGDRLATRICGLLMGENIVEPAAHAALADGLRQHELDVGWGVATVLRSHAFFARANIGTRVLGPVEYLVGAVRALGLLAEPPSTLLLADWVMRLGQDLFYPPNVSGWPGGRAWLTTRTLIGRANFAAVLVSGTGLGRTQPLDALALADRHSQGRGRDALIACTAERLLGAEPGPGWHARIAAELGPEQAWGAEPARRAVALVLACPEAQLG